MYEKTGTRSLSNVSVEVACRLGGDALREFTNLKELDSVVSKSHIKSTDLLKN